MEMESMVLDEQDASNGIVRRDISPMEVRQWAWNHENSWLAVACGLLILLGILISTIFVDVSSLGFLLIVGVLTIFYAVLALFLMNPIRVRILKQHVREIVERPVEVVREVPVDRIVEQRVEVPVEVPVEVIKEVPVLQEIEVERPVYITSPAQESKKLNIPKYAYFGSTETRIFHKRSCRFSKLIKKRFKVCKMQRSYFEKHGYKKCKNCLKK